MERKGALGSFLEFLKDGGVWSVSSTAGAAVALGFSIWEHIQDRAIASYWLLFASVLLFEIGGYVAWSKKRSALKEEIEKRGRPELTVECSTTHQGNLYFQMTNNSQRPAVNIHAADIEFQDGREVIRLEPPNKIEKGSVPSIECYVVGTHDTNIRKLFEAKRRPGEFSATHILRIEFTDVDAKFSWPLFCYFHYAYKPQRFEIQRQFIGKRN